MYSVILMAALTASGPEAASFGHKHRASCNGCYGYSCGGCYGGWSCAGCSGCWGCGGCWGWGGGSSCGGCYGVHGGYAQVAYGIYGCSGYHFHCQSCFGNYGGTACYGGCYGSCIGCLGSYTSCMGGCYGTPIWYGHGTVIGPSHHGMESGNPMTMPAEKVAPPTPKSDTPPAPKPAGGAAKLIIDAPADAKLFVDDMPIRSASRHFSTPVLEAGQTYYYTVRVESSRGVETRRVLVRANEIARESFGAAKTDAVVKVGH